MPQDEKRFEMLADMVGQATVKGEPLKKFNGALTGSKGDTIVIVHGHAFDLGNSSTLSEQYWDKVVGPSGEIIQKAYNAVPIDDILKRYNNPGNFAAVVLNGCNPKGIGPKGLDIPVFYNTDFTAPGHTFIWSHGGSSA